MINAIQIALSGLTAATKKTEAAASNIANLTTTGSLTDPENAPYNAVTTVQKATSDQNGNGTGVQSKIIPANKPFVPTYEPGSPFADENGMVGAPNVDLAEEAVGLNIAKIAYKANLKIIEAASEMSESLINMFSKKV